MLTRHTLLEKFSAFIELADNRFHRWLVDPRLNRSMGHAIEAIAQPSSTNQPSPQPDLSSRNASLTEPHFWTLYWHYMWQTDPQGRAYYHLMAFAQESCYWAAHKVSVRFSSTQYSLGDCFQMAIAGFPKILNSFSPKHGSKLDTYARMAFGNIIRDTLRQRRETDICSDWSLLRKLSQKRLQEAIATGGESQRSADYILAWQCFQALYVPHEARSTRQLEGPDNATWQAIAQRYHQQRHTEASTAKDNERIPVATLQQWLHQCAKLARDYLYPKTTSLNAPKPGLDNGELQDSIVETYGQSDDSADNSLLGVMVAQEDERQRKAQQSTINHVLEQAVQQLNPDAQHLLELSYGQNLNQKDIAKALGTKQYTVSRRLRKIRETLLKHCATWSQDTLHIYLTSDVLNSIGLVIDEWLCSHHAAQHSKEDDHDEFIG